MNPLDPLEGKCPAQEPGIEGEGGRCVREVRHRGWHASSSGSYFTPEHECPKCRRGMLPVLSVSNEVLARRCPVCGGIARP